MRVFGPEKISFYILGSILVIALITLILTVFKLAKPRETTTFATNRRSASFSPAICGLGTSLDEETGKCKPDEGKLISSLIESGNIKINYGNTIYYDPLLEFTEIIDPPEWYAKWTNIGGPLVCKTTFDNTDPYAGTKEKTIRDVNMKYSGVFENKTCTFKYPKYDATNKFVNNNITSAEQAAQELNTQQYTAERVTYIFSPDIDQCKQGYCYVNGICVNPYEVTLPIDNTCCPPCIYTPVSEGGCAGKFACDSSNPCKKERKVEYPGTQITSFDGDGRCENKLATSPQCTAQSTDECWSADNPDQSKRQPYKYYMDAGFENICKEVTLCDSFNGKNEFDCALSCLDKGLSQKDCSKRCLPKLWRWYPVFAKVGGQPKTFRGFMQSDELMQDIKEAVPPLLYCPPDTCVYVRDLGKNPLLNNCTGCSDIVSRVSEDNPKDNFSSSSKCERCSLNIDDVDSGDCGNQTKTLVCKDFNDCSGCARIKTNPNPLFDDYENKCQQCYTNDINKSCRFYTRIPYINNTVPTLAPTSSPTTAPPVGDDKKITLRPEVKVYNCAGTQPLVINPAPTRAPTTAAPTRAPTTAAPTLVPTTAAPTRAPTTAAPTRAPTTAAPTRAPTTAAPTLAPTTAAPTRAPTTAAPTLAPITTAAPTRAPPSVA
jgi:hypothetical protein